MSGERVNGETSTGYREEGTNSSFAVVAVGSKRTTMRWTRSEMTACI